MSLGTLEVKICVKIEFSIMYGGHFVSFFLKNSSRVPSWHSADFLSVQLRDAESTKKLHNSNKTHFDLIWLFGIWTIGTKHKINH